MALLHQVGIARHVSQTPASMRFQVQQQIIAIYWQGKLYGYSGCLPEYTLHTLYEVDTVKKKPHGAPLVAPFVCFAVFLATASAILASRSFDQYIIRAEIRNSISLQLAIWLIITGIFPARFAL